MASPMADQRHTDTIITIALRHFNRMTNLHHRKRRTPGKRDRKQLRPMDAEHR